MTHHVGCARKVIPRFSGNFRQYFRNLLRPKGSSHEVLGWDPQIRGCFALGRSPSRCLWRNSLASTYGAFMQSLEELTFDVLHVACDGEVQEDNIEKAELLIIDELVNRRARHVAVSANLVGMSARLGERRPLVLLNACEAGRLGESLTAWGGWPSRLIRAGAGAVVGASSPVRDVASSKFATAFYDALLAGKTLSLAASEARGAAAAIGDATWLAFKVFGDPHAAKA